MRRRVRVVNQRRFGNAGSDLFWVDPLCRGFSVPAFLPVCVGCTPVRSSDPRRAIGEFMVYVPRRTRFFLGVTTARLGESVVRCSSDRGAVLA